MKKIYKYKNIWYQEKINNEAEEIDVPDYVKINFLNSSFYKSDKFDEKVYEMGEQEIKKIHAQQYLNETDYVTIKRYDEDQLGLPHSISDEDFKTILLKREEARNIIRK